MLLLILAEECAEVAQMISKQLRFGKEECMPGQQLFNHERLTLEIADLFAMVDMCVSENLFLRPSTSDKEMKKIKVEKYLDYSEQCGTIR